MPSDAALSDWLARSRAAVSTAAVGIRAASLTSVDADWTGLEKMRQWADKTDTNPATV